MIMKQIIGVLLLLVIFVSGCTGPATTEQEETSKGISEDIEAGSELLPVDSALIREYSIVKKEDLSIKAMDKPLSSYSSGEVAKLPTNVRYEYRIVVPTDITKDELKATITKLVNDEVTKNPDIDEIAIFAYDRGEDADGAYTYGKADYAPNGKWGTVTPDIAESNDKSSYKIDFTIREKVGKTEDASAPTQQELEIYDAYDAALWDEENIDRDESEIAEEVAGELGISVKELNDIYLKVVVWKQK